MDDIEASGLLNGLTGSARAERAELIPYLLEQGITVEEIRGSFSPWTLPAQRSMGHDGVFESARQISERSGLDVDLVVRFMRAAGLPTAADVDATSYMRSDGDLALHVMRFIDAGIDVDQLLRVVRVLADGLSGAAGAMRGTAFSMAVKRPGMAEIELAQENQAFASAVAPLVGPMVEHLLKLELRHGIETEAVTAAELASGQPMPGARQIAVAFADLVGFTPLGELVSPEELEQLANRLSEYAHDVAEPPVRFIKSIGDAVMLVSTDTSALLDAVIALVDTAETDALLPQLRAGVAYGAAVSRSGDWFGSPVNLASRITSVALPGSVVAAESVREIVGGSGHFVWSTIGGRRLKGIKEQVGLLRVRVAPEPSTLGEDSPAGDYRCGDQQDDRPPRSDEVPDRRRRDKHR